MELSQEAQESLINAVSGSEGSMVGVADSKAHQELHAAGLIGPKGGLTRRGARRREAIVNARLDEMFG
jgi:hypothetical protein